tara:strand:- start:559 stop:1254 length:696 start_codon:yes stop_codon:yes gene_type:complete
MRKISLIIPCYNEEDNIPEICKKIEEFRKYKNIEVILVNNGSTDSTKKEILKIMNTLNFVQLVDIQKNQGYGHGIISGLKVAKGDILSWTHADLQTDPLDILKGLKYFEKNDNIFVKGRRKKRNLFDNFFTIGMSIFETLLLKKLLWDINAQPTMFSRPFFESWDSPPSDFSLDLYAYYMAKKRNIKIYRFNVFFKKRLYGYSKWNMGLLSKIKFIKRTLSYSLILNKKIK